MIKKNSEDLKIFQKMFQCIQKYQFQKCKNVDLFLSRKRSLAEMPADVEVEMRKAVAKFHMDYDAMCESDNTACTV